MRATPAATAPGRAGSTRTKKSYSTRTGKSLGQPLADWAKQPEGKCHEELFALVRSIKSKQVRRRYELCVFQNMYCNSLQNVFAASGLFSSTVSTSTTAVNRMSVNVVQQVVDTAQARIAKSKPRAFVLPNKGDYRLKRKCKKLTKFLDGAMHSANVYANGDEVFRDAGIYGTGAILIRARDGRISSEVVKVDELIIDSVDGMYDDPQEKHYEHPTSRAELLERYGDDAAKRKAIEDVRMSWRGDVNYGSAKDLVLVVETWRKPSTPTSKDGRHVVCISNATLLDEPWEKDYQPIFRFHWRPPTYGPFGTGIALSLEAMQWSISEMIANIDESVAQFAIPRIFVSSLGGLSQHHITDEISVIKTNEVPTFSTPAAMAPDVYQYLQWKIDQCFKQEGVSQLSAQGEKPAGLNSGVGLRTYQDVETQRFSIVGQRWERWYMQIARGIIDLAGDMYREGGKKLSIKVPGRGFIETVDWKDVSLEEDQYDLQVWPTNILPETPEGRLQTVQEMVNSGMMPRDVAIAQLNVPILYDWVDEETASREQIEMCLGSIIDEGKYIAPDPIADVQLAIKMAGAEVLESQINGLEPHKRDLLTRFLDRAIAIQTAANQNAAAPAAPPPPGTPVGQAPPPPAAPLAPAGAGPVSMPAAA